MAVCFRCERDGKEVKLNDAIYENDIVKVCERCAIIESIPVIRKPTTSQLKEAERNYSVYQRLKRLSGEEEPEHKHESVIEQIRELDENPELELPEKKPFNLIDNFQWHVTRARRNKGLSQKQLAWMLGESETAIKMIEKSELPEDSEKLIRKLEQFFQIKIRERTEEEIEEDKERLERLREKSKIPVVETDETDVEPAEPIKPLIEEPKLDETDVVSSIASGREIEEKEVEEGMEEPILEDKMPAKVLSFKPEVLESLTVSDLKQMKNGKERDERLSAVEEERKRALQAEKMIREIEDEDKKKQELRDKIASEMKDIATGKKVERGEPESIEEKKEMIDRARVKVAMKPEEKEKLEKEKPEKEKVPTIYELMEKKKEKEKEKITGREIEPVEE